MKHFSSDLIGAKSILVFFSSLAFLLSWLLPNHSPPWLGFCQDSFSFLGVLLLAFCIRGVVRFTRFEVVIFFVAFISMVQWLGGVIWFRGDAMVCFFYVFAFFLSIFIGRHLVEGFGGSQRLLIFFFSLTVFASVVAVWISLRQWLQFGSSLWVVDLPPGGRPFANFAQPNNYASCLLLGLVGVGYLFERNRLSTFVSCLLAFFFLFGVALSQSRTPLLGGLFAIVWVFWARGRVRLTGWAVCLLFAAYSGLFLAIPIISESLNIAMSNLSDRAGGGARLDLWVQMWAAIINGPFWGYGWGQASVAQTSVSILYPGVPITEYSHNIVLDILVWNGLIPGALLLAVAALFFARFVIMGRSSEALFCLLAVGFFCIHSMLEYPFAYAFLLFPIGILLGVLEFEVAEAPVLSVAVKYVYGLVLISLVVLLVFVVEYIRVEEDYRLMRFESARIGTVVHDKISPDVFFLDQLGGYIRFARTPATQGMSEGDIEFMKRISHRYPYSSSIFRYALALGLNGRPVEAAHEMLILRNIHGEGSYGEGVVALSEMGRRYPQLRELIDRLPK
ncbi:Wzy polymerase domain-containing protein [Pseudomonas kuykendallii]|nr:O-antigen ligase family protein [Pseudomonas kuykendallii]MCQ4270695.1 Wzy polymerase domain-containing protein [Pseudomonas kuykendallii]